MDALRILAVDDDDLVRASLGAILERRGSLTATQLERALKTHEDRREMKLGELLDQQLYFFDLQLAIVIAVPIA